MDNQNNGQMGGQYQGQPMGQQMPPYQPQQQQPQAGQMPPQYQGQQYQQQAQYQAPAGAKTAIVAGLLGIFLGTFGVHSFYLGYKKDGIIHVALCGGAVVCWIISTILAAGSVSYSSILGGSWGAKLAIAGILSTVGSIAMSGSGVWGLVEGIMIITKPQNGRFSHDAQGNRLM